MKRLTEHLWMLIGMAAAYQSMPELKQKMAERFGRQPVQFTLFMSPPARAVPRLPRRARTANGQVEGLEPPNLLEQDTE